MMRFESLARSIVCLGLSLLILLATFATPARSQSVDAKTAKPAKLSFSPKTLNFGNQVETVQSASKTITVKNTSKTELVSVTSVVVSAPFVKTSDDCESAPIAASGICTVGVAFKPTTTGKVKQKQGVAFSDTGQKGVQHVALEGKGISGPTPTATATPTSTVTATFTATVTATATSTLTATATLTPTPTSTGSGGPTPTATSTPTSTTSGSATPTPTPGPQAGDVLIAGGDTGGLVASIFEFAYGTVSTNAAEIYDAASNSFAAVNNLHTAREGAATVVLPNKQTLIVGGENCYMTTIPKGGPCTSSYTGFECDALDTAELYTQTSATAGSFAVAGSGSGFAMTTARTGATATLLADGVSVLITGGASGSSFLGDPAPNAGCGPSGQVSQNTAEIYDSLTDTFTATASIPGCPAGTLPPEACTGAGTPVACCTGPGVGASCCTNNSDDALPAVCGSESTSQCGLIDSAATLLTTGLAPGAVLVTGGDLVEFFAESSTQSFVYIPYYDSPGPNPPAGTPYWAPVFTLNTAREAPGIATLPSGDVLVAGGLTATSADCVGLPAGCTGAGTPNPCCTGPAAGSTCGPIEFTTSKTAEIFDPMTFMWTAVTAPMSAKRVAPIEQFTGGTDAGKAILAGGVDYEAGAGTSCVATTSILQTTQSSTDLFTENVTTPASSTFTATGALNADRGNYAVAVLNSGSHSGDLAVFGGLCAEGGLTSAPIGTSTGENKCAGSAKYKNDYYELFNPTAGTWSVGTATTPATPAAGPASGLLQ